MGSTVADGMHLEGAAHLGWARSTGTRHGPRERRAPRPGAFGGTRGLPVLGDGDELPRDYGPY